MTIDELLAAAGLTANDEIPIWDAEATGEPTKKITAQNLAAAVVALANLVTGVKGDAESSYRQGNVNITPANIGALPDTTPIPSKTSDLTNDSGFLTAQTGVTGVKGDTEQNYRHGDVNLTPANIGAVAKSGDTMTGPLTLNNADRGRRAIYFSANGAETGWISTDDQTNVMQFLQHNPNVADAYTIYQLPVANENSYGFYDILTTKSPVTVPQGGTDATTPAQARANLHAMQNPDTSAPAYGTGNFNDAPVGFSAWYGPSCVNAPFQTWTSVLTIMFNVEYVQQIAFSWDGDQIAYRAYGNGTWSTWKYITMS